MALAASMTMTMKMMVSEGIYMTNIEFQVPLVYKVMLFGLKLNIIATIFLVVEEGLQTF